MIFFFTLTPSSWSSSSSSLVQIDSKYYVSIMKWINKACARKIERLFGLPFRIWSVFSLLLLLSFHSIYLGWRSLHLRMWEWTCLWESFTVRMKEKWMKKKMREQNDMALLWILWHVQPYPHCIVCHYDGHRFQRCIVNLVSRSRTYTRQKKHNTIVGDFVEYVRIVPHSKHQRDTQLWTRNALCAQNVPLVWSALLWGRHCSKKIWMSESKN